MNITAKYTKSKKEIILAHKLIVYVYNLALNVDKVEKKSNCMKNFLIEYIFKYIIYILKSRDNILS